MTIKFLVIVGYWRIGIERCWKRLSESRSFSWKSNSPKFYEALVKANNWSFDLKSIIPRFDQDLRPIPILESQHEKLLPKHVVLRFRALKRTSSRSRYRPISSRRLYFDE